MHLISSERPGFASGVLRAAGPQILLDFLVRSESLIIHTLSIRFSWGRRTIERALSNHDLRPKMRQTHMFFLVAFPIFKLQRLLPSFSFDALGSISLKSDDSAITTQQTPSKKGSMKECTICLETLLILNINELVGSVDKHETLMLPHSRQTTWVRQPSSTERKDCQRANF